MSLELRFCPGCARIVAGMYCINAHCDYVGLSEPIIQRPSRWPLAIAVVLGGFAWLCLMFYFLSINP